VPHFEKMLYDQAQLAWIYLDAHQITGRPEYAGTARGILDYVARDLTSPEGAFLSAEDADSEGEEGRYYPTPAELNRARRRGRPVVRHARRATAAFEHGRASCTGRVDEVAERHGRRDRARPPERVRGRSLEAAPPAAAPSDDKVTLPERADDLGLRSGARTLGDAALRPAPSAPPRWCGSGCSPRARRIAAGATGSRGGSSTIMPTTLGLMDLYASTFEALLERAVAVTERQIERFDAERGGFFESPAGDASIALRMKDGFDGAEMAGNSIAAWNLQTLGVLLDRADFRERARRTFDYYARRLADGPAMMPQMLAAMDLERSTPRHVVIAGRENAPDARALVAEFDRRFLPHDALLFAGGGDEQKRLARLAPFVGPLVAQNGRATAYVCVDYACRLPTTDRAAFAAQLDERAQAPAGRTP
jgi:uncharacterized protein YyaL (SSP411 family)